MYNLQILFRLIRFGIQSYYFFGKLLRPRTETFLQIVFFTSKEIFKIKHEILARVFLGYLCINAVEVYKKCRKA